MLYRLLILMFVGILLVSFFKESEANEPKKEKTKIVFMTLHIENGDIFLKKMQTEYKENFVLSGADKNLNCNQNEFLYFYMKDFIYDKEIYKCTTISKLEKEFDIDIEGFK